MGVGSYCSIAIGTGIVATPAGSAQGLHLVASDINAARVELAERGVDVAARSRISGGLYVSFSDLDGNGWALQQLPYRD
jgi:hypothetical protein